MWQVYKIIKSIFSRHCIHTHTHTHTHTYFLLLTFRLICYGFVVWKWRDCKLWRMNRNCNMWPWITKPVLSRWGNSQKYIEWVKIIHFSFMPKIIRTLGRCSMKIFSKFLTVNISKINFWLVICIADNFICTLLKAIFSIFGFLFCTLRFQMFKYLYLRQILSYPNKPYINKAYLFSYMMYKSQFQKIDT